MTAPRVGLSEPHRDLAGLQDVVILGSGAFGLEAMEAAQRAGAKSITLVTRDRDRWALLLVNQGLGV